MLSAILTKYFWSISSVWIPFKAWSL